MRYIDNNGQFIVTNRKYSAFQVLQRLPENLYMLGASGYASAPSYDTRETALTTAWTGGGAVKPCPQVDTERGGEDIRGPEVGLSVRKIGAH